MAYPYAGPDREDGELITHLIYNADHQLHIDNNIPSSVDDYSANVTQMRLQTSPGGVGSESLATNLSGEIERQRHALARMKALPYWYLDPGSSSLTRGVLGQNNTSTPTTRYDLQAATILAGSLSWGNYVDINNAAYTVDIAQAGPVLNGRDQAGAFSANSFVHIYFIADANVVNPSGLLASTVSPFVFAGPTLPSGYTHWAYLTTLRLNASTQFLRTRTCNDWVYYEIDEDSTTRVLDDGVATSFTNVNLSALVPLVQSREVLLNCRLLFVHNAAANFQLALRPASAAHMTVGAIVAAVAAPLAAVTVSTANWVRWLTAASSIDYRLNAAPATSGGAIIEVLGYQVPNGA